MQCQAVTSITSEKNFEIIIIQNPTLPSGCREGVCVGYRGNQLSWLHNEENRYIRAITTYSNIYMGCGERRDAYQLGENYPVLCSGAHHKGVGDALVI